MSDYRSIYPSEPIRGCTGTHLDAPAHWYKGARGISDLTPEELFAHGAVIDVRGKCTANPEYALTRADVEEFERQHGRIRPRSFVCMKTGWDSKFEDHKTYGIAFPGFGERFTSRPGRLFLLNLIDKFWLLLFFD